MTEQSRFNDSPSEEELIFVLLGPAACRWERELATLQQKGGGSNKQQGRSTDGLLGLELEGREEGVRCTQQGRDGAQLHTQRE